MERQAGEPCAVKAASTVRGGGLGKVLARVTRLAPTLLHAAGNGRLRHVSGQDRKARERQGETEEHTIWFRVSGATDVDRGALRKGEADHGRAPTRDRIF